MLFYIQETSAACLHLRLPPSYAYSLPTPACFLYTGDTYTYRLPYAYALPSSYLHLPPSSIQETYVLFLYGGDTHTFFFPGRMGASFHSSSSSMYIRRSIPCSLVGRFFLYVYTEIDTLSLCGCFSAIPSSFLYVYTELYSYALHSLLPLFHLSLIPLFLYIHIPIYHAAMLPPSPPFHLPFAYYLLFL